MIMWLSVADRIATLSFSYPRRGHLEMIVRSPQHLYTGPLLRPLAACLAATLGIGDAPFADARVRPTGTIVVTNCDDSGAGSLRAAVQDDTLGDPIDLTQLACSQITLASGAIQTSRSLTLVGPGSSALTIGGNGNDRLLVEDATGSTLAIYGLSLQYGHAASASGGCVYAAGSVILGDVVVTRCRVSGSDPDSTFSGGGLYVKGDLTATDSRIVANEIYVSSAFAKGGGVFVGRDGLFVNSTISENAARSGRPAGAGAGGMWVGRGLRMDYSTVSGNLAAADGYAFIGGARSAYFRIYHSTISGNTADIVGGMIGDGPGNNYLIDGTVSGNTAQSLAGMDVPFIGLSNSTIAFNVATDAGACAGLCTYQVAILDSSIIADNITDGTSQFNVGIWGDGPSDLIGSNNLIGESMGVDLPDDTIQSDPLLAPLADNGGPTLTHALLPGSPAIDAGNNLADADWDQRGVGFARVLGAAPDIGAFEAPATNQAPVAEDDGYSTVENTTLTVSAPGVLADDSDAEGNPLTAMLVDDASSGQLTLNADGSFVYVPAPGFSGSDSFTYEANDGQSNSNLATVTIEVMPDADRVFASGFE
jgi:hypothetical protein